MKKFILFVFFSFCLSSQAFAETMFHFKLEEATIDSVHDAIKNHEITCTQLVDAYLSRIKKYNLSISNSAPINAFTEINPSVFEQALKIDKAFSKTQKFIGPLHCVPVILKDNIDSFDMTSTSGSFSLLGNQPSDDAFLVSRLRKAGAIIIGKGGMDEFARGMFGLSSRSGRVGNAFDPSKNPGGSSSGSAAGVSANFALVGIGTDNSGSVRIPAAFNGIVGLRPSTGLISQRGIFPMGKLDGVAGPLTRTVKDLAIVLDVIAQPGEKTYTSFLNDNGLRAKRIGIVRHAGKVDPFHKMPENVSKVFRDSFKKINQLGAVLIDLELPQFDNNREFNQAGEIQDINTYFAAFHAARKNFRDICESDRTRSFGDKKSCIQFMNSNPSKVSDDYKKALLIFEKNKKYIENIMKKNNLDALIMPISSQGKATYNPFDVNVWQAALSSNAGLPSIAIIAGYNQSDNLPIGIELIGKQFQEGPLIEMAYSYEKHTAKRRIPPLPKANVSIANLSISEYNNLITVIGKSTFEKVIKKIKPNAELSDELTPDVFRRIVAIELEKLQKPQ